MAGVFSEAAADARQDVQAGMTRRHLPMASAARDTRSHVGFAEEGLRKKDQPRDASPEG